MTILPTNFLWKYVLKRVLLRQFSIQTLMACHLKWATYTHICFMNFPTQPKLLVEVKWTSYMEFRHYIYITSILLTSEQCNQFHFNQKLSMEGEPITVDLVNTSRIVSISWITKLFKMTLAKKPFTHAAANQYLLPSMQSLWESMCYCASLLVILKPSDTGAKNQS